MDESAIMKYVPVVIIGAGPMGLAMAARLTLREIPFQILEKGTEVGSSIREWGHVNLFSNWSESIDPISLELLKIRGKELDIPIQCPSGNEFVELYLSKIGQVMNSSDSLSMNSEVNAIEYEAQSEQFRMSYKKDNQLHHITSKIVIDASGTWGNFNKLVNNEDYFSHLIRNDIPDVNFISGLDKDSKVAVVGNGHSAMNSLILLAKNSDCEILWIIRSNSPKFGLSKVGGQSDELEGEVKALLENGKIELVTNFTTASIAEKGRGLSLISSNQHTQDNIDYLISNIGFFPIYSLLREIKLNLDEKYLAPVNLAPKINPQIHSCGSLSYNFHDTLISSIPYYVIGMKSFGKASNFLLSKGYGVLDELIEILTLELSASSS